MSGLPSIVRERVERGARLLDRILPAWWERPNLSDLDFGKPGHDIVTLAGATHSQWMAVYGGYARYMLVIRGFCADTLMVYGDKYDLAQLHAAWHDAIRARRSGEYRPQVFEVKRTLFRAFIPFGRKGD